MTARWARLAPATGIIYVLGIVGAMATGSTPSAGDSGTKVLHFYTTHSGAMKLQVFLLAYAAVAGLAFYLTLGGYLRSRGASRGLVSGLQSGATVAMASIGLLAGTTLALVDHTSKMPPDVAATLNWMAEDVMWVALFMAISVSSLCIGFAALQTRAFPRWVGWVAVVIGVAALTGAGSWPAFMASGLLALGLGITLLVKGASAPAQITLPDLPAARTAADDAPARSTTTA